MRPRRSPALLLAGLLAPGTATAADARVLVLGNSYVFQQQVDRQLGEVLAATVPAWQEVEAVGLTGGGLTFAEHLARTEPDGEPRWRDALATDGVTWDLVVLQEQSQLPGFPQDGALWQESRDAGVALDDLAEARGADTVLMLTWGRRDGDSTNPDRYADFDAMQDHLVDGYLAYAAAMATDARPVTVGPAGLAFAAVRERDAARFADLYTSDGSHPSVAGGYLAAATLAAATSGWPVTGSALPGGVDLDAGTVALLQEAADAVTVDAPFAQSAHGPVPFSWATAWEAHSGAVAGSGAVRPTVGITSAASADAVQVGGAGPGRLLITGEAHAGLGTVTVGDAGTVEVAAGLLDVDTLQVAAGGTLRLRGGATSVATLRLDPDADGVVEGGSLALADAEGTVLTVDGGALTAGPDARLDLDLHLLDGLAALSAPVTGAGLDLSADSELQLVGLDPGTPGLVLAGDAVLAGRIVPTFAACEVGEHPLLTAASVALTGTVDGPERAAGARVADVDGGQALLLTISSCDDTGALPAVGDPSDQAGCRCQAGPGPLPWAALLLAPLALIRRRRP